VTSPSQGLSSNKREEPGNEVATTPETNRTYIWNASRRIVVNDWNSPLVELREIEQFASMKIEPNRNI
jgi:hypothetical protein